MYKRLLSLVNNFIHVERAHLSQNLYCMLLNVTPETIEVQTFCKDGLEETRWILPLGSVTGVATHSAEIDRLALTVKYAQSPDEKPTVAVVEPDAEAYSEDTALATEGQSDSDKPDSDDSSILIQ